MEWAPVFSIKGATEHAKTVEKSFGGDPVAT